MIFEGSSSTGKTISKPAFILFSVQITLILITATVSMANLCLGTGNKILWTMLLSSSFGYLMPNPKIKYLNEEPSKKIDKGGSGMR